MGNPRRRSRNFVQQCSRTFGFSTTIGSLRDVERGGPIHPLDVDLTEQVLADAIGAHVARDHICRRPRRR